MGFSLLNIIFILNALFVGIFERFQARILIASVIGMVSLVGFGVATVDIAAAGDSLLWPSMALCLFYFFYQITGVEFNEREKASDIAPLVVFVGFSPLVLIHFQNVLGIAVFLILFEGFKFIGLGYARKINEIKTSRTLISGLIKILVLLFVLVLALLAYDGDNFYGFDKQKALSAQGLCVVLGVLALINMGTFDSVKEEKRHVGSLLRENLVSMELLERCFIPAFLLINCKKIINKLEFSSYIQVQSVILGLWAIALLITSYKVYRSPKLPNLFFKIYFLGISAAFFFFEGFTAYAFVSSTIFVNLITTGLLASAENTTAKFVKIALARLILPNLLSPIFWFLIFKSLNYRGPLQGEFVLFILLLSLIGLILFSKNKNFILKNEPSASGLKPISLIGITIMTAFVPMLFIAKILT